MAFADIVGNSRIKKILKMALGKNRVPNSLLFSGPDGIGMERMALTLAKALNCLRMTEDSCDTCESCRAIDKDFHVNGEDGEPEKGRFPDVVEITSETKDIRIEQIRFLKQMAYLKPMTGKRRVFIINEADKMNEAAENSLLKVLEEPPLFSHIILVTARSFLLNPTIRSRCQSLAFSSITNEEIETILVERGFQEDQARIISLLIEGNLDRALELEWSDVEALKREAWDLFEGAVTGTHGGRFLERFGHVPKAALEELARTLEVFSTFCRDVLLLDVGGDPRFLLNPEYESDLRRVAAEMPSERAVQALAGLDVLLSSLSRNLNKNLLVTTFFSNFGEQKHV